MRLSERPWSIAANSAQILSLFGFLVSKFSWTQYRSTPLAFKPGYQIDLCSEESSWLLFSRQRERDRVSPPERLKNFYLLIQLFAESSVEELTGFPALLEKWQEKILNSFVFYKVEY